MTFDWKTSKFLITAFVLAAIALVSWLYSLATKERRPVQISHITPSSACHMLHEINITNSTLRCFVFSDAPGTETGLIPVNNCPSGSVILTDFQTSPDGVKMTSALPVKIKLWDKWEHMPEDLAFAKIITLSTQGKDCVSAPPKDGDVCKSLEMPKGIFSLGLNEYRIEIPIPEKTFFQFIGTERNRDVDVEGYYGVPKNVCDVR